MTVAIYVVRNYVRWPCFRKLVEVGNSYAIASYIRINVHVTFRCQTVTDWSSQWRSSNLVFTWWTMITALTSSLTACGNLHWRSSHCMEELCAMWTWLKYFPWLTTMLAVLIATICSFVCNYTCKWIHAIASEDHLPLLTNTLTGFEVDHNMPTCYGLLLMYILTLILAPLLSNYNRYNCDPARTEQTVPCRPHHH